MSSKPTIDIFQEGLIRGGANLAFDPEKKYFYVEHPTEGWRVYLRSCCFIHQRQPAGGDRIRQVSNLSNQRERCVNMDTFVVVKRTGQPAGEKAWEPPKGQMEFKDHSSKKKNAPIIELLQENVTREVAEESRITDLKGLRHTGLVFQGRESSYPPNHYFQYHIFQAVVMPEEYTKASEELAWYREHPKAFARLRRDKREKDEIAWFSPSEHRLMGKWSPKIVALYLARPN